MRVARNVLCAFVAVTVLCLMLTTAAFAAEGGSLWLNTNTDAQQNQTTVVICADVTVTNGMVELRYDASKLTYSSVEVSDAYVGSFAVNADTAGVIKIAWVAPGEYQADGTDLNLITLKFTGKVGNSVITVKGNAYDANGDALDIISDQDINADTGDTIRPFAALMALSVCGMAVCLTKKGWWAK